MEHNFVIAEKLLKFLQNLIKNASVFWDGQATYKQKIRVYVNICFTRGYKIVYLLSWFVSIFLISCGVPIYGTKISSLEFADFQWLEREMLQNQLFMKDKAFLSFSPLSCQDGLVLPELPEWINSLFIVLS